MTTTENAAFAASLSAGDCELIVHNALRAGDMPAVVAALRLLAVKDPHRAEMLLDIVNVAIDLRRGEEGEAR